jgi:hypothetical protein
VAVPTKLSRREKDVLAEFASLSDESPRAGMGID